MSRPTGVTALGVLNILGGIGWLGISLGISYLSSIIGASFFSGLSTFGNMIAGFAVIAAVIQFIIAGALLKGKKAGRIVVIVFSIIHLVTSTISLPFGNIFAIISIIFDLIVLYYMWRPHVISYFKDSNSKGKSYCKYCSYAATSYSELRDHQENCQKKQKQEGKSFGKRCWHSDSWVREDNMEICSSCGKELGKLLEKEKPKPVESQQSLDSFVTQSNIENTSVVKETINDIEKNEKALGVLKERLAKGEISVKEYQEIKKEISS